MFNSNIPRGIFPIPVEPRQYDNSDYRDYVEDSVLPLLKDETGKHLSISQIIEFTQTMKEIGFDTTEPIFVVTKNEKIQRSDADLYFPSQYSPKENWENQKVVPLEFISAGYLNEGDDATEWKEFFKKVGVKEAVSSGEMISEFGKNIVESRFKESGYEVSRYGGRCDLVAQNHCETLYIEVKSTTSGNVGDENLEFERFRIAQQEEEYYYLAKVINIPDAPHIYLLKLKDPINCDGVIFKMTISSFTIETCSIKINAKHLLNL